MTSHLNINLTEGHKQFLTSSKASSRTHSRIIGAFADDTATILGRTVVEFFELNGRDGDDKQAKTDGLNYLCEQSGMTEQQQNDYKYRDSYLQLMRNCMAIAVFLKEAGHIDSCTFGKDSMRVPATVFNPDNGKGLVTIGNMGKTCESYTKLLGIAKKFHKGVTTEGSTEGNGEETPNTTQGSDDDDNSLELNEVSIDVALTVVRNMIEAEAVLSKTTLELIRDINEAVDAKSTLALAS